MRFRLPFKSVAALLIISGAAAIPAAAQQTAVPAQATEAAQAAQQAKAVMEAEKAKTGGSNRDKTESAAPVKTVVATAGSGAPPTPAQIHQWIEDLSSQRYRKRQSAKKRLIAAGEIVRPAVKKALNGLTTPEMRHEMRAVIYALNNQRLLSGKLITLELKHVSPETAFDKVARTAGITFSEWPPNLFQQQAGRQVTLHAHNEPLLRVLWSLARQTNISPSQFNYNNMSNVLAAPGGLNVHNPVDFDGSFLTTIDQIDYHKMVSFNNSRPQITHQLMVSMIMAADPTLRVMNVNNMVVMTIAKDNLGHSLLVPNAGGQAFYYGGYWNANSGVFNLSGNLNAVPHMGKTLALLKGKITVTVGIGTKSLVFSHLHKAQKHDIGGIRIKIGNFMLLNQNQYQIQVSFGPARSVAGNVLAPNQQAIVNSLENSSCYTLEDKSGHKLSGNMAGGGGGPTQFQYNFGFFNNNGMIGKPTRLIITVVTGQKTLHVPFTFKNVPLP